MNLHTITMTNFVIFGAEGVLSLFGVRVKKYFSKNVKKNFNRAWGLAKRSEHRRIKGKQRKK